MTVRVRIVISVTWALVTSTFMVAKPAVPFCMVTMAVDALVVTVPSAPMVLCMMGWMAVTV
jgi:hypothetical protein